jgi:MoaA/NifB/PqqE/SkfB family radical SAM enzyme
VDADRARSSFWTASPELAGFRERLTRENLPTEVLAALLRHLADPTVPALDLTRQTGCRLTVVRQAYRWCQTSRVVSELVTSPFYPHRLRCEFAAATVQEWAEDPERFARLLAGQPVLSRTVEIHPSKGTCNYSCVMCLWSDKRALTYSSQALEADGLLATEDWLRVLRELRVGGAVRLVISGGGEALLNRDLPTIMTAACALGFRVLLYTTGFNLRPHDTKLWAALLGIEQVRFSIHSPFPGTYDAITGLPSRLHALACVAERITSLLRRRTQRPNAGPRVGIGFVIQPRNHDQIVAMARFAAELGVDFLDIRKDEVDVTEGLSPAQLGLVRDQLNAVQRGGAARPVRVACGRPQRRAGQPRQRPGRRTPPDASVPGQVLPTHHQPLWHPGALRPEGRAAVCRQPLQPGPGLPAASRRAGRWAAQPRHPRPVRAVHAKLPHWQRGLRQAARRLADRPHLRRPALLPSDGRSPTRTARSDNHKPNACCEEGARDRLRAGVTTHPERRLPAPGAAAQRLRPERAHPRRVVATRPARRKQ